MASSPDITSMALFCDFENVALGVRDTQHEKFDIKLVLERLLLKGSIVVKKAYCDWERYKGFKATMHEANFELIEIPHVRQSGKNSADIRLVVDALDLCYTKAHVNTFVIISGDSDFSPLVSKLRENNKQVIGVGVKQSTSDLLTANCDEFIFYDDLVRESGRQSVRRDARPAPAPSRRAGAAAASPEEERKREESESRRSKAVDLAVQTFEALYSERGDGGKIWASVLKEAIKRRKPDFSESYSGFRSFGGLLEEAQARGFLEMGRDEKSNAFVFRSSSSGATQQGHATAAHAPPAHETGVPSSPAAAAPDVLPLVHRVGEAEQRERERGRAPRSRGRRGASDRHDFEPTLSVDATSAAPAGVVQESDEAAEHFADAAREAQARRDSSSNAASSGLSPESDADAGVGAGAGASAEETAQGPDVGSSGREPGSRRGGRGQRGRRGERDQGARSANASHGQAGSRTAAPPSRDIAAASAPIPSASPPPEPAAPVDRPSAAVANAAPDTSATPNTADISTEPAPGAKRTRARTPARRTSPAGGETTREPASAASTPASSPATAEAADRPAKRSPRPRKAKNADGGA